MAETTSERNDPAITADLINECLDGFHAEIGDDGKCIWCGEQVTELGQPAIQGKGDTDVDAPYYGKDVILADGPLEGMTLVQVPADATMICEMYTAPAEEPYFGTLYKPFVAREAYYAITGRTGKLMRTATLLMTRPIGE